MAYEKGVFWPHAEYAAAIPGGEAVMTRCHSLSFAPFVNNFNELILINMILDIHTHHLPPEGMAVTGLCLKGDGSDRAENIISENPTRFFSVGIHPWDVSDCEGECSDRLWERLSNLAGLANVVAIGECGIDLHEGTAPLFRQMQVMKRHIELSEELQKPMIIHDVKGHDILIGMRRDLNPKQKWALHGFRLKPSVAAMMLRAGFMLSFGPNFNPETLRDIPADCLLAETDDADISISDVIVRMSAVAGRDITPDIAENSARFLGINTL